MTKSASVGVRRSPSLALQVHAALRELITSGRIQPGERVVIKRLAEQLGVSQTPVHEAVARLAQEGLIVEAASGSLHVVELTDQYVREVFLVRGALEGLCAELVTPLIRAEDLAALRTQMNDTAASAVRGDHRPYTRSDLNLHQLVIAATTNQVLARELQSLQPHIDMIHSYSKRAEAEGAHLLMSHQEHLQIIAAIADRDGARARYAMEQHIRSAGERIVKLITF